MNSKDLNNLILWIDGKIKDYSIRFNFEKVSIEKQLNNEIHFLYERTLASVANYFIGEYLSTIYTCKLIVNEFPIRLLKKISDREMITLCGEVDNKSEYHKWKNCYVDGYFKVENLHFAGNNSVFVEYKLDKKFKFAQLATDYLKYKIYTKNDKSNTIFAFVVFDKAENYPTILSECAPHYCILDTNITVDSLKNSRVFLYIPDIPEQDGYDKTNTDVLNDVYNEFDIISRKVDEINQIGIEQYHEYDDYQKLFIENIDRYNSRVIKANYIRDNYKYIYNLWKHSCDILKNDPIFIELNLDDKSKDNVLNLIIAGSTYLHNFEANFHKESIENAQKSGLKVSNFSSFNMIVLLDFFNDIVQVTNDKPLYYKKKSGRRKNDNVLDYSEIASNLKIRFSKMYLNTEENKNKIKKLGLELLYFLVNIYPLIFEISDDYTVIDSSASKKINDNLKLIQKSINKIKRKTDYKRKINVVDLSPQSDDQITSLAQHIISRY